MIRRENLNVGDLYYYNRTSLKLLYMVVNQHEDATIVWCLNPRTLSGLHLKAVNYATADVLHVSIIARL